MECMYVCMYVCMHVRMYVRIICVCMYVCVYACTYVCIYVCVYGCMYKFPLFLENKLQLKSLFLDNIKIYGEAFCEACSFIQALCKLCIVLGR